MKMEIDNRYLLEIHLKEYGNNFFKENYLYKYIEKAEYNPSFKKIKE